MGNNIIVAADLGQSHDFSALFAVEKQMPTETEPRVMYVCRGLKRWALGTSYPQIVTDVGNLLDNPKLACCPLVMDATGVGRPILDMFRISKVRARVWGITITAGNKARWDKESGTFHVAKILLVHTAVALFQQRRIKLPEGHPGTKILTEELADYRIKITVSANETFAAREGKNDDYVLATSMALWWGEKFPQSNFDRETMLLGKRASQFPDILTAKQWNQGG